MDLRFHLDENVHTVIADGLHHRNMDVTTPRQVSLAGAADDDHLRFAREQSRVIITHDPDFLKMHADGIEHAGIAGNFIWRKLTKNKIRFGERTKLYNLRRG